MMAEPELSMLKSIKLKADIFRGSAAAYTCRRRSLSGWPPRDRLKTFSLLRPNTWLVLATWIRLHSTSTINGNHLVGMITIEARQATMKAGCRTLSGNSWSRHNTVCCCSHAFMNTRRSSAGPPCLQLFQLCRQDRLYIGFVLASICHTTKV